MLCLIFTLENSIFFFSCGPKKSTWKVSQELNELNLIKNVVTLFIEMKDTQICLMI